MSREFWMRVIVCSVYVCDRMLYKVVSSADGALFGNVGMESSSRVANVICTKGTRHGRPFGDQLKWQTVCRAVAMETVESSSELVNRPLSSLTTSNVPCPSTACHSHRIHHHPGHHDRHLHHRRHRQHHDHDCLCPPRRHRVLHSALPYTAAHVVSAADSFVFAVRLWVYSVLYVAVVHSRWQSNFYSAKQTPSLRVHTHSSLSECIYTTIYVGVCSVPGT